MTSPASPGASGSSLRLTRMLALVPWLQAHPGVSLEECAEHFGITVRQLESDLWTIVMCGVPGYGPDQLVDIQFWDDGRVYVIDALTLDQPMRLTPDESLAVHLGLRMLAQVPGAADIDDILTAAAKLEALGESLPESVAVVVDIDDSVRHGIEDALAQGRGLRIRYGSGTDDTVSERVVIPVKVYATDSIGYLDAWCTSATARRTFRLDRIMAARVVDSPGTVIAIGEAPSRTPHEVTLQVAPAARWVCDVLPGVDVKDTLDDGTIRITVPVDDLRWASRFVLSQGGDITVVAPQELIELVTDAARAALGSYS